MARALDSGGYVNSRPGQPADAHRAFFWERLDGIERQALGLAGVDLGRNLMTAELDQMSTIFHRAGEDAFLPLGRHELLILIAIIADYLKDGQR